MTTITRPPLTAAEDAIRAHLNNLLADASEQGDQAALASLEGEADAWEHHRHVTPARAEEILRSAHPGERDAIAAYLAGSRP
jgi:hypothetical protein